MITTIFSAFQTIFNAIFGWLGSMFDAVGNFTPIFLGIFATIMAYRFVIAPILGGSPVTLDSAIPVHNETVVDSTVYRREVAYHPLDGTPFVRDVSRTSQRTISRRSKR